MCSGFDENVSCLIMSWPAAKISLESFFCFGASKQKQKTAVNHSSHWLLTTNVEDVRRWLTSWKLLVASRRHTGQCKATTHLQFVVAAWLLPSTLSYVFSFSELHCKVYCSSAGHHSNNFLSVCPDIGVLFLFCFVFRTHQHKNSLLTDHCKPHSLNIFFCNRYSERISYSRAKQLWWLCTFVFRKLLIYMTAAWSHIIYEPDLRKSLSLSLFFYFLFLGWSLGFDLKVLSQATHRASRWNEWRHLIYL